MNLTIPHIQKTFSHYKDKVKRKAQGALPYDYLVPSGVYEEQWDWDAFFMGMALSSQDSKEAIYLKNWTLNFIHNARVDGYTPGCVTPKGRDERLNQMKPFLAQGAYYASQFLNDFDWLAPHYEKLKTIVIYREKNLWNKKYNLAVWFNSMESGADNNLAALNFPDKKVVATDLNSYLYLEYIALSLIAAKLKNQKDEKIFNKKAQDIKKNTNKYLWDEKYSAYYNLDSRNGKFIKRISFNSFHPLWTHIAPPERAKKFIEKYAINPKKMWSKYGIRTLSKDDPGYNNINMIKPHSNWQGPIWPIANYLYMHSLLNYGYQNKAIELAQKITKLCLLDIEKTRGMHENYNAETGEPLAAPNFISWNLSVANMLKEATTNTNPFKLNI
jgi:alpha,alpha-trehalase